MKRPITATEQAIIRSAKSFGYVQRWTKGSLLWSLVEANIADKRAKKGKK